MRCQTDTLTESLLLLRSNNTLTITRMTEHVPPTVNGRNPGVWLLLKEEWVFLEEVSFIVVNRRKVIAVEPNVPIAIRGVAQLNRSGGVGVPNVLHRIHLRGIDKVDAIELRTVVACVLLANQRVVSRTEQTLVKVQSATRTHDELT